MSQIALFSENNSQALNTQRALVYRSSQKSVIPIDHKNLLNKKSLEYPKPIGDFSFMRNISRSAIVSNSLQRKYDFKEFLSITPNRIVKYSKNMAIDLTDYTSELISKGAVLLPDGTWDKSNMTKGLGLDRSHHGLISSKSSKEVNKVIDWMVLLSRNKETFNPKFNSSYSFKINFVTMTLPSKQRHSDKVIQKQVLQPFLDWIRKTEFPIGLKQSGLRSCSMYFWRAEAQANGNIHFHICTDCFIPYIMLRTKWNYLIQKLGYIDEFQKKHNHRFPPTEQVKSVRKIKKIGAYLSKYCGKNAKGITVLCTLAKKIDTIYPKRIFGYEWTFPPKKALFFRQVHCRLWACSEKLSKLKKCKVPLSSALYVDLVNYEKSYSHKVKIFDYVKIFDIDCTVLKSLGLLALRSALCFHVLSILNSV